MVSFGKEGGSGNAAYLMHAVNHMMCEAAADALKKEGISFPQAMLLGYLKENENENINQKSIQKAMNHKASSVTSLVGNMIKKGIVVKRQNPSDAREYFISLTDKGRDISAGVRSTLEKLDAEEFSALEKDECEVLKTLLLKLKKGLKGIKEPKI
jgi:DNA-binding MarR family transcriptional regulator